MVGTAGLKCFFLRIKDGEAPMDVLQHTPKQFILSQTLLLKTILKSPTATIS